MANPGDECSSNGRPPYQNIPNNDEEEAVSMPRPTQARPIRVRPRLDLGLHLGVPVARPLARPPMQIHWPHLQPAAQPPPRLHFRAPPPPPPPPPDVVANSDWRCPICNSPYYNIRALCGHMRVHKNRGWRGIRPPPELCKPQGLSSITNLYPKTRNNQMMFPSLGIAVGSSSGGGRGWLGRLSQPAFRPWIPLVQNFGAPREEREGGSGRNPGKRPAPPEEQTQEAPRKSKRVRGGGEPVPDLNGSPPPQDKPEGSGGEGGGTAV